MQVKSIDNNNTSFGTINRWNIKGKDIKQLPEELELIKGYVKRIENHPYYQGKDMVATIRSRDYQYFPDMCATQINSKIDNVPRYSVQISLAEQAKTIPQKLKKTWKNIKALFMPFNQKAFDEAQPYSMVSGGTEMDTAIYSLLGRLKGGEIPHK